MDVLDVKVSVEPNASAADIETVGVGGASRHWSWLGAARCGRGTREVARLRWYERHGYQRIGTLDGYPPGSRHFHLAKRLAGG